MLTQDFSVMKVLLSLLLFPTFFQTTFLEFAWGAPDPLWLAMSKRLFLLLPVLAFILACWVSMAALVTVLFRPNRRQFITDLFITWWDLGKAVLSFWGGIFKFLLTFFIALANAVKMLFLALWSIAQELFLIPFRILGTAGRRVVQSNVPWIAVSLTVFWCLIEAMIFTYVTTPLVVDTFSNITGDALSDGFVRIPLFIFLLFVVMGSYAVLSTLVDSVQNKSISAIAGIAVIEVVVLFVEVVFLYREFVDSLVPWFAQYSENFELGVFWTLAISTFVWFGIRSLSWFLFAAHGTPTILSIIQGKGLQVPESLPHGQRARVAISPAFFEKMKSDLDWVQKAGDELVLGFMLPPLQVVAAAINFCILLISGEHLFEVPLRDVDILKKLKSAQQARPRKSPTVVQSEHKMGELPNVTLQ